MARVRARGQKTACGGDSAGRESAYLVYNPVFWNSRRFCFGIRAATELLQRIVEHIEGNQRTRLLVHDLYGGFLEQRQHGAFAFCKVLAGCAVRPNGGQHAAQQIKLIGNKGIA